MPRCVFDTNAVVSAVLFRDSISGQALYLALRTATPLVSRQLVNELTDVFRRPRFDHYSTHEERLEFLQDLIRAAETIEIIESVRACRDPADDKILELAVNGNADYIVTGDDDLLVMNPRRRAGALA